METLKLKKLPLPTFRMSIGLIIPLAIIVASWFSTFNFLSVADLLSIDLGIIQVILLALVCWFLILYLAQNLMRRLAQKFFLHPQGILSPINTLTPWEQYVLYLAFYALVVLSGIGCLIAIC